MAIEQPLRLDQGWHWPEADRALPHVLLVVDQFPKALGGGERAGLRLAELLPEYGFRASVLTFSIHPESPVQASRLTFPVYLLPLTRTWDLAAMRAGWALGRFLRQQRVAIVQTFFESSDLWAGFVTKVLSDAKLIWSRRDMGILRSAKHRVAYRLMAELPDRVFAVSERVRRHCIEVDGVDSERACTVYTGLDLPALEPRPRRAGPLTVTTVGNIRWIKGHDVFVRAAALVLKRFPETVFSIAGEVLEPGYYTELERLVREAGIADRFHFAGGVSNVQQHLRQADVFVLPSRSEGFSNAILEAMAAGLPVIATDVGGNAEAVEGGVTGLLVAPGDARALAAAICSLLADPASSERMGAAGRALAERRFSTAAMMRRLVGQYRELIPPAR